MLNQRKCSRKKKLLISWMILMTLQLVVTQTCCEAKLSPYSLHWNRYTFGLCYCGLFSNTILGTFSLGLLWGQLYIDQTELFHLKHVDVRAALQENQSKEKRRCVHCDQEQHCLKSWKCSLLKNLGPPWQNQEYPHPSSQDSESSCFWHCLKYFLWSYKNQMLSKFACKQIQLNLWDGNWVHRRQWGNRRGSRPSRLIL